MTAMMMMMMMIIVVWIVVVVDCLTSQQHASVSQGRTCSDKLYVSPH